jgi:hypothetical protein
MKGLLLPYGVWYAMAAWAAAGAALAGACGDVLGAAWGGALAVGVGVCAVRSRVRWSRSGDRAVRAEMMRLIDERAGSGAVAWLDRDAHLLFSANRRRVMGLRERSLMVIDEEQQRDVEDARDAGGGKVAVTSVSYMAHPAFARVLRRTDGFATMVTADDIEMADSDGRESWWRGYVDLTRTIRAGLAFADAGELAETMAQFRDAEPISPDAAR